MHRSLLAGFASAALVFVASAARADEPSAPTEPLPSLAPVAAPRPAQVPPYAQYRRRQTETREVWYGWQTLVADGSTLTLGVALSRTDSNLGVGVALGGYLLGGPIVHWAHGNVGTGFASFGVRIGLPTALALIGLGVSSVGSHGSYGDDTREVLGTSIGMGLGMIGAIAIDAAALAREPRHPESDDDDARNGQTPAFHASAGKGLFVPGSLGPILEPRRDVPGSSQITGGVLGVSAALY